jgi:GNAT superfamily N-acetyltransferase
MPGLVVPSSRQVRAILEESYSLWGAGLSLSDYAAMWDELAGSAWGRRWFGWRAWVDDGGRVLSSLKLYRPSLRLEQAAVRACALGAVFTPRSARRKGHAAALIRSVLSEARRRGDGPGLLFTDIGTDYYAKFGFVPLPCEDTLGSLAGAKADGARGVTLRTMRRDDLDTVAVAHARFCEPRELAIVRDLEQWEFLLLRAETFFRRLDGSGLDRRFVVAEDGGRPIGYLIGVLGAGEWNLREAAAFDGDPDTLRRVLAAGGGAARAAGASSVWGWIPRAWHALVPEWRLRAQPRPRAIPMIRPAGGRTLPPSLATTDGAFVPYLDQF